jgi:hypothetical protein
VGLALLLASAPVLAADDPWWNDAWAFRAPVPESAAPALRDVYAVKADFTALLTTAAPTAENLFDAKSIRVIGVAADGQAAEAPHRFLPSPDFNALSRARGTLLWRNTGSARYWVYLDSIERGTKPDAGQVANLSINLLPNGGFDQGKGDYRPYSGVSGFDKDTGHDAKGSMKLFSADPKGDYTGVETPKVAVEVGKSYGFEFYAGGSRGKDGPTGVFAYMDYADANGKYLGRTVLGTLSLDGQFHWEVLKGVLTIPNQPAGIKKIGIHAGMAVSHGVPVWLDDIQITPEVRLVLDRVQPKGAAVIAVGSTPNMDRYEVRDAESNAPETPPDEVEKAAGFQVWASHPGRIIYEYSKAPANRKRTLELTGAPGETLSGTFCVRPFEKLDALTAEIAGAELKPTVQVRRVRFLAKQETANSYRLLPECLETPAKPPSRGVTAHYFLTVRIPKDLRPGSYAGSVTLTAGDKKCSLPVSLRVFPFTLEKPEGMVFAMTYAACWWNEVFKQIYKLDRVEVFDPAQQPQYFRDMVEHNVNGLHYAEGFLPPYTKTDKGYAFDFTKLHPTWQPRYVGMTLSKLFNDATQAGIELITIPIPETPYNQPYFQCPMFSDEWNGAMVSMLQSCSEFIRQNKWPQRVVYTLTDEPANSKELTDATVKMGRLMGEKAPGLKSAATLHKPVLDALGPVSDVCIMQVSSVDEEVIAKIQRLGKEFWVYNGGSFGDCYLRDRLFTGFYAYRTGAKGILQFAYMWPKGPDAYDDFKGTRGAGIFYAYPSPDGPKDTVGLEGWRDGVNDFRYLYTLKKTVDAALKSGDESRRKAAQAAWDDATKFLATIPVNNITASQERLTREGTETLDAWRNAIAERIIQLQAGAQRNK